MKWNIERVGSVERKLRVEISGEEVDNQLTQAYRAVNKKAQVKGFRKGKVPKAILKRQYSGQVHYEVAEKLVQLNVESALQEADQEPVENISVDQGTIAESTPFEFTVSYDVMALPESVDSEGITMDWPNATPTEEDIENRLNELRKMKGELVPVEDRGSAIGDTVNVSMIASCEGEVLAGTQADQQDVVLDPERLLPGLGEGMTGMKDGDTKDIPISFPEDFADPNLASKEAVFSVTIHGVKATELPDLDDEFAVDLGLNNLSELRERVTTELQRNKEDEGEKAVRDSLFDQLIEKNPLEIPEALISMRTREMMGAFFKNLEKQGISPQALGDRLPEQMSMFQEQAKRVCHERALTKAIIELAGIEITDEDLKTRVEALIGEVPEEQKESIIQGFIEGDSRVRLKSQVEYEKVREHIVGARPESKPVAKKKEAPKKAAKKTQAKESASPKKETAKKKAATPEKSAPKKKVAKKDEGETKE